MELFVTALTDANLTLTGLPQSGPRGIPIRR
jgi:hypothetical protein